MWRSRIRNAVLASPPTPAPQRPGPGRSVRRKLATTNAPAVLRAQDLRPARQRAVEEAHVVAAREPDRRRAVGDDARDREVADRALDAAAAQGVGPAADDGDVTRGRRACARASRSGVAAPRRWRRGRRLAAGAARARDERQTGEEQSPPDHANDDRSRAAPPEAGRGRRHRLRAPAGAFRVSRS